MVPAVDPAVTIPDGSILATEGVLLLHDPPAVAHDSVLVPKTQTLEVPVIAAGETFIVATANAAQPVASMYVTVDVPLDTAVSIPDVEPIVAIDADPVLHVPPDVLDESAVANPSHTVKVPDIDPGTGFITTVAPPVIALVHAVDELVANTVYTPAVVCRPNEILLPVPDRGDPTVVPARYSW